MKPADNALPEVIDVAGGRETVDAVVELSAEKPDDDRFARALL